jgi:hypothetical protein
VPASSAASDEAVPICDLVPADLRGRFMAEAVPIGAAGLLITGPATLGSLRRVSAGAREWGGRLGGAWFESIEGSAFGVATSPSAFAWHSHPDGSPRFSLEDQIALVASGGVWHLLITADSWAAYRRVAAPMVSVPLELSGGRMPALRMLRVARWAQAVLGPEHARMDDRTLCELFGLSRCGGDAPTVGESDA